MSTNDDHEKMRLIRARVEQRDPPIPLAQIAAELGETEGDLIKWIMAYKAPRRAKPYLNRESPPLIYNGDPISTHHGLSQQAKRFENWRRSTEGARAAREGQS